jgi:hypothetical protein
MDGSLLAHATPQHGRSVNFFAFLEHLNCWVRAILPTFGFFFYHTLNKVVCPHLAAILGMPIWHSSNEDKVDAILAAQVYMYILQLCLSRIDTFVTQSFDNKYCS